MLELVVVNDDLVVFGEKVAHGVFGDVNEIEVFAVGDDALESVQFEVPAMDVQIFQRPKQGEEFQTFHLTICSSVMEPSPVHTDRGQIVGSREGEPGQIRTNHRQIVQKALVQLTVDLDASHPQSDLLKERLKLALEIAAQFWSVQNQRTKIRQSL